MTLSNKTSAIWARAHPEVDQRGHAKRRYKLTDVEYDILESLRAQGCMICGKTDPNKRLSIDHNHVTGKVRGLLCVYCNTGIGWLETHREAAREYLEAHND